MKNKALLPGDGQYVGFGFWEYAASNVYGFPILR
jgi:hypothetical protein